MTADLTPDEIDLADVDWKNTAEDLQQEVNRLQEENRRLRNVTFGDKLVQFVGEPALPFLARVAAGKAAKAVVCRWREAGAPEDVETLRTLFPVATEPADLSDSARE